MAAKFVLKKTPWRKTVAWVACLSLLVMAFHLITPSVFNAYKWPWKTTWSTKGASVTSAVELHQNWPPFAKRPVTNAAIQSLQWLGLSNWWAFFLTQGVALFACGLILAFLMVAMKVSARSQIITLVFFYSQFSILFAFFASTYSYDDIIQLTFLFAALWTVKGRGRSVLFSLALLFSFLTRETSLLLVPGFVVLVLHSFGGTAGRLQWRGILPLLPIGTAVVTYAVLFRLAKFEDMPDRVQYLRYNFQSIQYALETAFSFLLTLGTCLTFILFAYFNDREVLRKYKAWVWAFLISVAINSVVVICTAKARETRLFALPMVFLLPWAGTIFDRNISKIKAIFYDLIRSRTAVMTLAVRMLIVLLLIRIIYNPTNCSWNSGFRIYLGLTAVLMSVFARPSKILAD